MVREVMMKRMGEVDSEGVTSWKMREVTILACPYKKSLGQQGATTEQMTDYSEPGGPMERGQR